MGFPSKYKSGPIVEPNKYVNSILNLLKYLQVDLYVSRDLDSRLNEREQAAVQEWLHSSKGVVISECIFSLDNEINSAPYTGKSLSEAFILTSTNPHYDKRLFIDLPVQYMKTTSSEHVVHIK